MLNKGRKNTLDEQIRDKEELLKSLSNLFITPQYRIDGLKTEIEALKEEKFQIDLKGAQEQAKKNTEQIEIQNFRIRQKWHNNYASWKTKRDEELAKLEAEKYALTKEQYEEYKKQINYKHRDRQMPGSRKGRKPKSEPKFRVDAGTREDEKAARDLLSLQSQLEVLKKHQSVDDIISQQRKDLWKEQAQFNILEEAARTRKLTLDEKSLLASKESILAQKEKLAVIGDEVEAQKKINAELDQQHKRVAEIEARTRAMIESAGKSDRIYQQEIALEKAESPEKRDALTKHFKKEEALRGNWEKDIQKGFAEFQDQATNTYANVAQISQATFAGMSNTMADFLLTGKANFADFTKSVLEMITKMLMQMAMLQAMKAAFGGTEFGKTWFGYAGGGYTGDGGKYEPKGIVHGGEFVFTKEATMCLGVANLYRLMDSTKKGYASGGHVGGSQPMTISTPAPIMYGMQPVSGGVTLVMSGDINIGAQQQQQVTSTDSLAVRREFLQIVEVGVNRMLNNPASALYRTIKGR